MICKRSKQVGIRPIIIKPEYKELIVAWFFLGRYLKYDFKASLEKKNMGFQKKNTRFSQAIKVEASFSTPRNSQPSLLVNGWPFGKVSMMCFGRKAVIPLPHLKYTYLDIYIYIYLYSNNMLYMYLNIFFIPFCYTNTLNPLTYNSSSFLVKWHPKTASSSANNANPNSTAGIQSCHLQDSPGLDTEKQPDIKKRATPNRAPSNQGSSETLNLKKEKTSLEAAFEVQKRAKNKKTVSLLLQSFIEI